MTQLKQEKSVFIVHTVVPDCRRSFFDNFINLGNKDGADYEIMAYNFHDGVTKLLSQPEHRFYGTKKAIL
jgi:hypothetical protein